MARGRTAEKLRTLLGGLADPLLQLLGAFPVKWRDLRDTALGAFALLRHGPWGVASFAVFALTLAGFVVALRLPPDARAEFLRHPVALSVQTAAVALTYALLLSEVRGAHPLLRFAAGLYAFWYLLLPPVLALPRLAALAPGLAAYALEAFRLRQEARRPGWLLPWVLVLARLSPAIVRPSELNLVVWAVAYLAVGLWCYRRSPNLGQGVERSVLLGVMAATYVASFLRAPVTFAQHLQGAYAALFTFLGVFWMWLGADLVDDVVEVAGHAARMARRWVNRPAAAAALAVLLVTSGAGLTAAYLQPAWVVDRLPWVFAFAAVEAARNTWTPLWPVAGALLVVAGLSAARHARRPETRLEAVGEGAAVAVAVALLVYAASQAVAAITEGIEVPQTWWTLLLATAPVLLEEAKQAGKGFRVSSAALLTAAVTSLALSVTATRFVLEPRKALENATFYPLVGILALGFPYLLARMAAGLGEELPSLRLFVAGYLCALPASLAIPRPVDGSLILASLLWPWALAQAVPHLPGTLRGRLASGLLLASGTVAFYHNTLYLPLPFVPWTDVILARLHQVRAPEFLSAGQLVVWSAAALAATLSTLQGRSRWVLPPAVSAAATLLFRWLRL